MKHTTKLLASIALGLGLFAISCTNQDEPINNFPPLPSPQAKGFYIVNAGQYYSSTTGSLGYYDYDTQTMSPDLFLQATGTYVGDTFNDGYVYGNQIWLAVTGSAVLHVLDLETYELKATLQPNASAGPRHITAYDGYIYCTLFNETPGGEGFLCRIDPETYLCTTIPVGPQPEYVVPFNGMLYVAVSDGYSYGTAAPYAQSCVAVVDPTTFTVKETLTGIINPVQLATNGQRLFVQSSGQYNASYQQIDYGIYEIVDNQISAISYQGTYMAISSDTLYFIDSPYSYLNTTGKYTYYALDLATDTYGEWIPSSAGVYDPSSINVDPNTNNVILLSYREGAYGYPDYSINGYMNIYTPQGQIIASEVETGIGPATAFFPQNK